MYKRLQKLAGRGEESCFLWGPRQTGKTTLLKQQFPKALTFDLLLADEFERFNRDPTILRQTLIDRIQIETPVIIDEIQKVPALLDEIQWLIVNKKTPFILCGSSARKLKRSRANLLGGRAIRYELHPLVYPEITGFDLLRALNYGLIPNHYIKKNQRLIQAYIGEYLREEIAEEGIVRNLPSLGRFLEIAAFSNGDVPIYKNIAQECGVSPPTVKEYFQILEDTLIGRYCRAFQKRPKRRVIQSPRFYYFDVGITNFLLRRAEIQPRSEVFEKAFEHFIFQELLAHSDYSDKNYPISYWHTTSQLEVDFVLGDHEVAIEVKGRDNISSHHMKGLIAFQEEYRVRQAIIVSLEPRPRKIGNILILPWKEFLDQLWHNDLI